jgi:hypothetical protein
LISLSRIRRLSGIKGISSDRVLARYILLLWRRAELRVT